MQLLDVRPLKSDPQQIWSECIELTLQLTRCLMDSQISWGFVNDDAFYTHIISQKYSKSENCRNVMLLSSFLGKISRTSLTSVRQWWLGVWERLNKLCAWRHDMPRPSPPPVGAPAPRAPPSRRNVAEVSHAQYVLTVTAGPASRVKAAVSKAAWWRWPLSFWPWKRCSSHVWRGLSLCQFWSSYRPLSSRLRPDVSEV